MKACIVSAATITKYGRMDAGFFCGLVEGKDINEDITRAEARLTAAAERLRRLCQEKMVNSQRIARMIQDGEIRPI